MEMKDGEINLRNVFIQTLSHSLLQRLSHVSQCFFLQGERAVNVPSSAVVSSVSFCQNEGNSV
jgi:hypothetical protein